MRSLPAAAERSRPIPSPAGARLDAIQAALVSLGEETRRLERLGFELPLARCHEQRRYWSFLHALYSLPTDVQSPARAADGGDPWR